jgi:DNA-binding transcriptional MerR regulator
LEAAMRDATEHAVADRAADPPASFGIGAVARRLGVEVATLRSWDRRYGIGAGAQSAGGHRRYTAEDVARLERMCRLADRGVPAAEAAALAMSASVAETLPDATPYTMPADRADRTEAYGADRVRSRAGGGGTLPLGRGPAGRQGRGLAKAAMRLDADAVGRALDEAFEADGVVDTWQRLIVPVLFGMGRKWETANGGTEADTHRTRYVEVEHMLTHCVSAALHRSRARSATATGEAARPSDPPRHILLACTAGELHTLALEALDAALAERGLPVRMFGAALPREALLRAVRRTGPRAVVLWSHTARTCDPEALALLRGTRRTAVVPAGPGWRAGCPDSALPVPATLREAVRTLTGGP